MQLANKVWEIRRQRGLTQAQLAQRVGVTRQTIISTEKGYYVPSVKLALLISSELGAPINELFWLEDEKGV
jgi:putative transcriptional regulator